LIEAGHDYARSAAGNGTLEAMSYQAPRTRSTLAMPRRRGMLLGLCLIALGIWGGMIPFVGPYFHYAFINLQKWHYTTGRLWLSILPGAATVLAGLILLFAANRATALFAGWLAAAAGAWFVVGSQLSRLWNHGVIQAGHPFGGYTRQTVEQLGYFYALGAAILLLAGIAIGRASLTAARDVLVADGKGRRFGRTSRASPAAPAGATAAEQPTRTVGPRQPMSREPTTASQQTPAERPASGSGDASA
jgi:hypothetical protein